MQRDRRWSSYEDVEARYERRPSALGAPLHHWGPGRVELVQLPRRRNPLTTWLPTGCPQRLPAPARRWKSATSWHGRGDGQQRPPSAWATRSRKGVGSRNKAPKRCAPQVQYVVDFLARHCTT